MTSTSPLTREAASSVSPMNSASFSAGMMMEMLVNALIKLEQVHAVSC
jgi:hypothetical protein